MKNIGFRLVVVVLAFTVGVGLGKVWDNYKNSFVTPKTEKISLVEKPSKQSKDFKISIAVPKDGDNRIIGYSAVSDHFSVVITNISDKPQKLWKEWCSWGYFSLSFEIEENGKIYQVEKAPRSWFRNYPDCWLVYPNESLVIDVRFGSGEWNNFPLPTFQNSKKVKIKAIFENEPLDFELKGVNCENLWVGKIYSEQAEYIIYNYKR